MGIKIFIDNIEVTTLKVSKTDAANIIGCSRNLFDEKYVATGLIIPVVDKGFKRKEFWVQDLIAIRDKQLEIERQKKNTRVLKRRIDYERIMKECYEELDLENKKKIDKYK